MWLGEEEAEAAAASLQGKSRKGRGEFERLLAEIVTLQVRLRCLLLLAGCSLVLVRLCLRRPVAAPAVAESAAPPGTARLPMPDEPACQAASRQHGHDRA